MNLDLISSVIDHLPNENFWGTVTECVGLIVEAECPGAFIGEFCEIKSSFELNKAGIQAEVIGFREGKVLLMPYDSIKGIRQGDFVKTSGVAANVKVGRGLLGRVVDATSKPIDGNGDIIGLKDSPVLKSVVNPLMRQGVDEILPTGIKAIDGFTTLGKGQRVGLFAGSGVGKSTLISSICNHVVADVKVIALVGERGREVEEFVSQTLGDEGIKNSVVIASTAQESPLNRVQAAYSAITIAEYFANSGNDVFFAMDSITRFATALREVGLAAGEPPTVKGYTPSVFSAIPNLIERCGNFKGKGSISAMFSVLVESDDFNDPIVDCTRAILDGHILLSRDLAEQSHFPAIDIAKSISRLQSKLVSPESIRLTRELRKVFSNYQQNREILELGFFDSSDGNPQQKSLKNNWRNLEAFLLQNSHESLSLDAIQKQLEKIEIE